MDTKTTWTLDDYCNSTTTTVGTNVNVSSGTLNCSPGEMLGYSYTYPYYQTYHQDKTAQAYRVAKVLIEKKLVECRTAKSFCDLMDELVKAL